MKTEVEKLERTIESLTKLAALQQVTLEKIGVMSGQRDIIAGARLCAIGLSVIVGPEKAGAALKEYRDDADAKFGTDKELELAREEGQHV